MRQNPCRDHLFEVFRHIDKSTTELAVIRDAIDAALRSPPAELGLSEADLNNRRRELLNPLARLREEIYIHQPCTFELDGELQEALDALGAVEEGGLAPAAEQTKASLLGALTRFVPVPIAQLQEDDLPWPEAGESFPLEFEPTEETILRNE